MATFEFPRTDWWPWTEVDMRSETPDNDGRTPAEADAIRCRAELLEYYEDQRVAAQARADSWALMGRTVQYLDDAYLALEHRRLVGGAR
tara:strand:+ start:701 stop:967 length:267 start_codon:yes stop_codon:yes gene_type:complete